MYRHRSTGGIVLSLVGILAVLAALALPAGARDSDRQTHGDPAELAVVDSPETSEGSGGALPMCPILATPAADTLPTSLRWSVEEASDLGCDVVQLSPGDYEITAGTIDIATDMTLVGLDGASSTTVRSSTDDQPLFLVSAGDVSIVGLHISTDGQDARLVGQPQFPDCSPCRLSITDSVFEGANTSGAGAAIQTSGELTIERSEFANNTSSAGGAIFVSGSLAVVDSEFTNNTAMNLDGGAISSRGEVSLEGVVFTNNSAPIGGALSSDNINPEMNEVVISDSSFVNNSARVGGAFTASRAHISVDGSLFDSNEAEEFGRAILVRRELQLEISASSFVGNLGLAAALIEVFPEAPFPQSVRVENTLLDDREASPIFFSSTFGEAPSIELVHVTAFSAGCLLYTSPSPRDRTRSRMPSSA